MLSFATSNRNNKMGNAQRLRRSQGDALKRDHVAITPLLNDSAHNTSFEHKYLSTSESLIELARATKGVVEFLHQSS